MASSEENIDLATPVCNLVLWIIKQKKWGERAKLYFTTIIFNFGDKNYEASDYNKNKCIFLSECDFKKRALKKVRPNIYSDIICF